ncbi:unnamed protein product [Rotaria socialis]|uniref:GIY-YIG domain-containing protein n=1 Tax=Rotaria socialis TaxID=392032 RepID=A0A820J8U1_9BILA|nr:unnamed protein product [Rotaria socialis]CAF3366890.1 unnamed protein product [Rotaria socialis]CAF3465393.1 unnamed protein product [Rotaria socialis]CAF3478843.1 unnamed protein product [Rotaria socialis]CAF3680467.1 unnamed protein product [Rotaria socialis]
MMEEFDNIRKIATDNGYPIGFIEAQIRRTLDRYYNQEQNSDKPRSTNKTDEKQKDHICTDIPYYEKSTEKLVQLTQCPPPTISTFFTTKDKIPTSLRSGIVYEITCQDCSSEYIGITIRQVQQRLIEHGQPPDTTNNNEAITQTHNNPQQQNTRPMRTIKPINRYSIDPNVMN